MPAMLRVAAVLAASASVPFKVIVTTPPVAVAVAPPDPVNPVNRAMVGAAGMVNDDGKVTVMVFPATRAPVAPVVNPIVQVVPVAPPTWDEPEKVTLASPVMTTLDAGETAVASAVVATENVVFM